MKLKFLALPLLCGLLLSACGGSAAPTEPTVDVAAVRTSAASTVEARFTLTAAAFTPTPPPPTETETAATEEPEATPTATSPVIAVVTNAEGTQVELCDSLIYVADVTVPDGTIMSPGQDFVKTWRVRNTGACPWGAGYVLAYAGYSVPMSGQFIAMTEVVQPGQEVDVSVQFTAPSQAGEYLSAWTMRNPQGVTFPQVVFVKIIVQ
ncbi:MAG: hypothetical protein L6Q26_09320 [Anaerolineales bacterium]|nr:hypothetical protein [Anaerolineales bacterium]NUQ84597.1 hypothetical protein [Anaerolineales bacterium]